MLLALRCCCCQPSSSVIIILDWLLKCTTTAAPLPSHETTFTCSSTRSNVQFIPCSEDVMRLVFVQHPNVFLIFFSFGCFFFSLVVLSGAERFDKSKK